jgi:oligoribonuclease
MSLARKQDSSNLVWVDLEMTGLNPKLDVILQLGLIITNSELKVLESYCVDVWQPEKAFEAMVPFVRQMHEKNGLLERCLKSKADVHKVQQEVMERVTGWCPYRPILCGNTIHSDRKFIDEYMPSLAGYLHYRMVDVSSLKVLSQLWYPQFGYEKPRDTQHDALFDIQQSIAELSHYRQKMFKLVAQ